jgi:G2/mitotic-specific cyclin-B, other
VGVSALLIACKYEEIYPPELKDFVYITDRAYSKEDVLQMEFLILSALSFDLTLPTSLRFLERYMRMLGEDESVMSLS